MGTALPLYVLLGLGFYLVFPKYGEAGWKAFVPVWRWGIHACRMGMERSFHALCVAGALVLVMHLAGLAALGGGSIAPGSGLHEVITVLGNLAVYLTIALFLLVGPAFLGVMSVRTARRFGKPLWFAAGLCLLWPAFMIALGMDRDATYLADDQSGPTHDERLVEIAFASLAMLCAFVLFSVWVRLSFNLPNQ